MDPISQGIVGAVCARTARPKSPARDTLLLGALAGMAPDLDVLIRSGTDPLLFLEYHRQFTHSIAFAPIGALIVAAATLWLFKSSFKTFIERYWICLAGYFSHGFLDATTTYGTQLYFPFADTRIAWNVMSIIDPLYTLPLLLFSVLAILFAHRGYHLVALLWMVGYVGFGTVQRERAEDAGLALAITRGHQITDISAKPGFASLLLWKTVYEWNGRYFVDGLRMGTRTRYFPGESVSKVNEQWLATRIDPSSRQWSDFERFKWFSQGYVGMTPERPSDIMDVRYSMLIDSAKPLWFIRLDPDNPNDHVAFISSRDTSQETVDRWWCMLTDCSAPNQLAP